MVDVEVSDEDLVDLVIGDLLSRDPFVTAGPKVEQELVTVPQLDQQWRMPWPPCPLV